MTPGAGNHDIAMAEQPSGTIKNRSRATGCAKPCGKERRLNRMTKPTQRERVLKMLEAGPVCGTTLLEAHMPRYAAVVYDLRTKNALTIITRPCTRPGHRHETAQIEYQLVDILDSALGLVVTAHRPNCGGECIEAGCAIEKPDASHSLGSNDERRPAPSPSAAAEPDRDGEATTEPLFDLEDTARGPDPWLST